MFPVIDFLPDTSCDCSDLFRIFTLSVIDSNACSVSIAKIITTITVDELYSHVFTISTRVIEMKDINDISYDWDLLDNGSFMSEEGFTCFH